MQEVGDLLHDLLQHTRAAPAENGEGLSRAKVIIEPKVLERVRHRVKVLLEAYPLYPELITE